mmetsp:Transcript_60745/g.113551  ORF Transcript_60745/g.113551 Transcript_60745/m.113551 type:complete len:284 (+) Transcript_60745:44-895(+)
MKCLAHWTLALCISPSLGEWALVNLIRHGERFADKAFPHLAPEGFHRAEYIARCASAHSPSLAFPRGPASQLLAGQRQELKGHNSSRPFETLQPLAQISGTRLDNDVDFQDVQGFVDYLQAVPAGSTVLVAWEHKVIGKLAAAIDPTGLAPERYPDHCAIKEWNEPDYTEGACYDVIWQFLLHRTNSSQPWQSRGFLHMHMGFAGLGSPCRDAFAPYSNPSSWGLGDLRESEAVGGSLGGLGVAAALTAAVLLLLGRLGPGSAGLGLGSKLPKDPSDHYVLVC